MADLPTRISGSERTYGAGIPIAVTALFVIAVAAIFAVWLSRDLEEPGGHSDPRFAAAANDDGLYVEVVEEQLEELAVELGTLAQIVQDDTLDADGLRAGRDEILAATDAVRHEIRDVRAIRAPEARKSEDEELDEAMEDLDEGVADIAEATRESDVDDLKEAITEVDEAIAEVASYLTGRAR